MRWFLVILAIPILHNSLTAQYQRLSESEAVAIVKIEERAKEKAKDDREVMLLSAEIIETAVADFGPQKVVFNLVKDKSNHEPKSNDSGQSKQEATSEPALIPPKAPKESVSVSLSGNVYDNSISELWWDLNGERYRIFTNANFLYLSGIGTFEDADHHYSVFSMIFPEETQNPSQSQEW